VTADIEHMFHCFAVSEHHRNYLRFFWYGNNDQEKPLTENRMCVHVFGNTLSPAVVTFGLRQAAITTEPDFGKDVYDFIRRNFYVHDALVSLPTTHQVVDLLRRTQQALRIHGNLRLHKIISSNPLLMQQFPAKDLAKDLVDLNLDKEELPSQRSLGIVWNLRSNSFGFRANLKDRPFTRRGVFSCVNSLYDPLGFIAPITIRGKILLREMMQSPCTDWDANLAEKYLDALLSWIHSLCVIEDLKVSRKYFPAGFSELEDKQVLIFTDASELAISAVAYLLDSRDNLLGFIMGKSKVAPKLASSVPRLELCAAVLGIEIACIIPDQLDVSADHFKFFTDCKIVLGYIYNRTKRFLTYVSNRIQRILTFASANQWNFIATKQNPADHGTKPIFDRAVYDSWFRGPVEWLQCQDMDSLQTSVFELVDPASDREIKQEVLLNKVHSSTSPFGTHHFEPFSSWKCLVRAIASLKLFLRKWRQNKNEKQSRITEEQRILTQKDAEELIIHIAQHEHFAKEINAIKDGKTLQRDSCFSKLDPFLNDKDILQVGGRLRHSDFDLGETNPTLIPSKHRVSRLLVSHYHEQIHHQGRHITEGAIRSAG
jgi:hypothetical protein